MNVDNNLGINQLLNQMREMTTRAHGLPDFSVSRETSDFTTLLKSSINQVNKIQQEAGQLAQRFDAGDKNVNLSEVMLNLQKANVTFQAMTQVRNRLVAAYQDIMNMQI